MAIPEGWNTFYNALVAEYWDKLDSSSQQLLADADIPEDIRQAACMIHPHPTGWIDNPIPNFDGKTARKLMTRKGGANKVRVILMEIAPAFLPEFNPQTTNDA